jgi:Leucine-rich repeat (LRR) protein
MLSVFCAGTIFSSMLAAGLLFLRVMHVSGCTGNISVAEYNALYDVYTSTAGWNWNWDLLLPVNTIWYFPCLLSDPCSQNWQGVTCSVYVSNSSQCAVTELVLEEYNLQGTLPASVEYLTALNKIDMYDNSISGTIPSEIGNLVNLEYLGLEYNLMSGSLPTELGLLVGLYELYIYENSLEGTIPSEIGCVMSLEYLDFGSNLLEGSMPVELFNATHLFWLILEVNLLTGSFSTEIGRVSFLTDLYLDQNFLTSSIPTEFGQLVALQYCYLDVNLLTSYLPTELGLIGAMSYLDLDTNSITGSIPTELGQLTSVIFLDLTANYLSSSIPSELGRLDSLQYLYLGTNCLEGSIPGDLGGMLSLDALFIYYTLVEGRVPSEYGNSNVTLLYLYYNYLTGPIPPQLGEINELLQLWSDNNWLSSTIPSQLGNAQRLHGLLLNDNLLSGSIPPELCRCLALELLWLSYNMLTATIPTEIGIFHVMTVLYLDNNQLTGSVPSQMGNMLKIEDVSLNTNMMTGLLPGELGFATNMNVLLLYGNIFTGRIPAEFGLFASLVTLSVEDNFIRGAIPLEMLRIPSLVQLSMNNNLISGQLPTDVRHLTNLQTLDLDWNHMSGTVPALHPPIANLLLSNNRFSGPLAFLNSSHTMKFLDVSCNRFTGTLPKFVGQWRLPQALNISSNRIVGSLGSLVSTNGSLGLLGSLDVSNNHFSGTLPFDLFVLPSLQTVVLSHNCVRGSIPSSICDNSNLQNIVLNVLTGNCGKIMSGFNGFVLGRYLVGTIPNCIWNSATIQVLHLLGNGLTGSLADLNVNSSMSILAVGSNQLTGTIPESFQRHSFEQLDLSINRLSGTLIDELNISSSATSVYELSANRLSGTIPPVLHDPFGAGVLNVLEGNLFGCNGGDVPTSDASHNTYQCGSNNFQYALLAWMVALWCVVFGAVILQSVSPPFLQVYPVIYNTLWSRKLLHGPFTCFIVAMVGLLFYLLVKLLSDWKNGFITHDVQYWWTACGTFLHGWAACLFLMISLSAVCIAGSNTLSAAVTEHKMGFARGKSSFLFQIGCCQRNNMLALLRRFGVHAVNITTVILTNGIYVVLAVNNLSGIGLLTVQSGLGIFKLCWSMIAVPRLVTYANSDARTADWIFMVLFVFVGAPFASTFCESSSCFLYILVRPSVVTLSFDIASLYCTHYCYSDCLTDAVCVTGCSTACTLSGVQTIYTSVFPPWMYSYQCSSAVITNYAPVLVFSYLVSGVIVPFVTLLATFNTQRIPTTFKSVLSAVISDVLLCADGAQAVGLFQRGSISRMAQKITIKYILGLAVMITFGLAVPLLSAIVLFETIIYHGTMVLILERFTELCVQGGLKADIVRQAFWESALLDRNQSSNCCYIMMGFVGIFWSLFVFDMIGDVYGPLAGGLTMWIPVAIALFAAYWQHEWQSYGNEAHESKADVATGLELQIMNNPILKSTVDARDSLADIADNDT